MGRRDTRLILASHWIEALPNSEEGEENTKLLDYVAQLVDELPEDYRLIVEAIAYERLTYREAADRLGYKAHSQLYYKYEQALKMLQSGLEGIE